MVQLYVVIQPYTRQRIVVLEKLHREFILKGKKRTYVGVEWCFGVTAAGGTLCVSSLRSGLIADNFTCFLSWVCVQENHSTANLQQFGFVLHGDVSLLVHLRSDAQATRSGWWIGRSKGRF